MSNFKKRILNILSDLDYQKKKKNNYKININGINNNKIKKGNINPYNYNKIKQLNELEYKSDYNINNNSYIPKLKKNKYNEVLTISKNKLNKNLNITLFNENSITIDNNKFLIPKNSAVISLNYIDSNKNHTKYKLTNIPKFNRSNNKINYYGLESNKNYIKIINNNNKKTTNLLQNKNFDFIKKKILLSNFKLKKSSIKNNKKTKINCYSKINAKRPFNKSSNSRIKEKIKKMENEFSSNEVKKILINRPMRTLNSKNFQFNSKELKYLSPTYHVLNNSRIKQSEEQNKKYKKCSFFSERYRNNIGNLFKRNNSGLNDILDNYSLSKSGINNIFNLSQISDNNSINNNYIFNTKIKIKRSNEDNNLYKEIMQYNKSNKMHITREYQRCSKYIRNDNRTRYFKNSLLTSFNKNLNFCNISGQFSF